MDETELTAVAGPVEQGVRPLVERLRNGSAPLDDPNLNDEAAAEIERLATHIQKVEDWHRKGDDLLNSKTQGALFTLGSWWADRPWRKRAQRRSNLP